MNLYYIHTTYVLIGNIKENIRKKTEYLAKKLLKDYQNIISVFFKTT